MDDRRFDNLTRFMATGTSRRHMLKGLAATLLGGLAATGGARSGAAVICRQPGVLCATDAQCCSDSCAADHRCACPDGGTLCGRTCVDTSSDPANCGGCGTACTAPANATATCTSGACGYACNDGLHDCGGACQACCSVADCPAGTECARATCNGGQCGTAPVATGQACGTGPTCSAGQAKTQDTCDGSGTCVTGATTACAPYVCGDTACLTSCGNGNQCVNGDYCGGGQCLPLQGNGTSCSDPVQCQSGFCVDGVCCDSACGGQCEACNLSGASGSCTAVAGQPVGNRTACTSDGSVCGGSCDGTNTQSCSYPSSGTTCRQASCSDGTETLAANCDGAGHCPAATAQSCGAFICGPTACLTSCTDDDPCVTSAYCDTTSQTCKQDLPQGQPCGRDHQCLSGHCVDGVCCGTACTDQCTACNVSGAVGTCTAVSGQPVGGRTACANDDSNCGGSCDGTHTTCTYPGSSTTCGSATCTNGTFTPASTCDGTGNCAAGTPKSCSPYLCGTDACQASCTSFTDCADGYYCNGMEKCVACTPLGQNCAESACCTGLTCDIATLTCRLPNGQSCTADTDCASHHCVSGVCCDQACSGPCQTCSSGTCTDLADGQAGGCQNGQTCQGGQCVTPCLALQTACSAPSQCCQDLFTQCETAHGGTQTQCCRTPGIFCNETADCCGDGTCGTTRNGPNHCCLPDGHSCDPNNQLGDCCDGSGCFGGVCCNPSCAAGECGLVPKCAAAVDCGTCPDGEVCNNNACCTPQSTSVTCNGRCGPVTNNCGQTVQCSCDALHNCVDGQCHDCMPLGGTCGYPDYASGCCQATGTTYCESNCCHHVFGSCTGDFQCCGAAECGGNGACCYPLNFQDCSSSDECCGGLVCAGYCCNPKGASCNVGGECCSGSCFAGSCSCIPVNSGSCASDSDCCAEGSCCNGVCRDLQLDGYNCGSCDNDCGNNGIGVHIGCCFGSCCPF